jgi:hypothetical protein
VLLLEYGYGQLLELSIPEVATECNLVRVGDIGKSCPERSVVSYSIKQIFIDSFVKWIL